MMSGKNVKGDSSSSSSSSDSEDEKPKGGAGNWGYNQGKKNFM